MKTPYNTANKIALEIYLPQHPVLTFVSCKIPDCLNTKCLEGEFVPTRIGTRLGSVLVLGDEVVQVVPIQSFVAKQNCSSKHLDRTSNGPGLEQILCLNSLSVSGTKYW